MNTDIEQIKKERAERDAIEKAAGANHRMCGMVYPADDDVPYRIDAYFVELPSHEQLSAFLKRHGCTRGNAYVMSVL